MYNDDKWLVSVEGQIDAPFDTKKEALDYAAAMEAEGFECALYFCPKDKPEELRG